MPQSWVPGLEGASVVVTGAAGFIGAGLTDRLVSAGCEVTAVVRPGADLTRIDHLADRIDLLEADVAELDPAEAVQRVGRTAALFHLACAGVRADDRDAGRILQTNVTGTLRVLQAARGLGCERFVYCGSCFEYGQGSGLAEDAPLAPRTEYGASKAAGWLLAQAFGRRYGLPVVGVRPFTVYGPQEGAARLVPSVVRAALSDEAIELTAGSQRRDFVYVADAVEGLLAAAMAPDAPGEVFNLCTGQPLAVSEVVKVILAMTGSEAVAEFGALQSRVTDVPVLSGDPGKALRELGWKASTSLTEGVGRTIAWHREQLEVGTRG